MAASPSFDEHPAGLTWVIEGEPMQRASHALADSDRVWIVDPIDAADAIDRAVALGEPAAVLQLLDRHNRDCAAVAARLGIPHLINPDSLPDAPFATIPVVRFPGWRETSLWWPQRKALVVAEVVGSNPMITGGSEPVGMHMMLRALPPGKLRGIEAEHLLMGHGLPVHGPEAAAGLETAYHRSRRDLPRVLVNLPKAMRS